MTTADTLLFSWIGETDLRGAGVRDRRNDDEGDGPIAQAIKVRPFRRLELLCNYKSEHMERYVAWLRERTGAKLHAVHVELGNPTHHADVHAAVVTRVDQVLAEYQGTHPPELTFHLSPGTPAMHAVWLLLAKSKYEARLIQTTVRPEPKLEDVDIPFEIDAVFVGDYYRPHDERLQELAAGSTPVTAAFASIEHKSEVMAEVIRRAERLAPRAVPVLILGESGTGKELFATAIHNASPRKEKAFRAVNCGAIPEALVESELFGHKKGAFTGADKDKKGIFESADGGTVFLDEVGDLLMAAQVKLLRVLQEGEVQPVGEGGAPKKVDVRVLAATHKDLPAMVVAGKFREDLFYRLAIGVLHLPALRDRGASDLNHLIDVILADVNKKARAETGQEKKLSPGARKVLRAHPWPGNVRELVNTLTRAVIHAPGPDIREHDAKEALLVLPRRTDQDLLGRELGDEGVDIYALIDELKRHYVRRALEAAGGQKTKAAELLRIEHYQTLSNWMQALKIELP